VSLHKGFVFQLKTHIKKQSLRIKKRKKYMFDAAYR